jgi:uncharacterized protein (UPF0333 family)
MKIKRGQVSVEFAMLIGFVTFLLIAIIGIAYYYSGAAKEQIKVNSLDKVGKKIADTADSIFYLGPPSKATIKLSVPIGVRTVELINNGGNFGIMFNVTIKGDIISNMFYETQGELRELNPEVLTRLAKEGLKSLVLEAKSEGDTTYVELSMLN